MENFFISTNHTLYIIVFGVLSLVSGVISVKFYKLIKTEEVSLTVGSEGSERYWIVRAIVGIMGFMGSIVITILHFLIYIIFYAIINIPITWAIGIYYVTGNYIPIGIYFCTTILGMFLEGRFRNSK